MNTSAKCTDLLQALCAARLQVPTITRNREGFSKRTGQKYQYADLNALIDATEPVLGQHGLVLVQSVDDGEEGTLCITSTLFHAPSGQWMSSDVSVEKPADMQAFGMVCTYLKRYAQQALLNISTEDDDDAASLHGSSKPETSAAAAHGRPSEPVSTNGHTNGHTPAPEPDASLNGTSQPAQKTVHGNGHAPKPAPPKGAPKNLVQKSDLLREIQAELTRIGRPVGEVTALYQAAFGTEVDTWDLVCGESLHTLKHGLAYLKTLTPEVPNGSVSAPPITPEPTPATGTEGTQAVPPPEAVSSSAASNPEAATIERDRQRLRAEVASWHLTQPAQEIEQVIVRYSYARAWSILQKYRQQPHTPIDTMAAD